MADYASKNWVFDEVIDESELDAMEAGIANAVGKSPSTAQAIAPDADVIGLTVQGRSSGTKAALKVDTIEFVVAVKTAAYTLTNRETVCLANATTAAFTVTLPPAAQCVGRPYIIKKTDATVNAVTVDGNGAETIDGALTRALLVQYSFIMLASDGTNWFIIG
jgi:hypothetical protein